MEYKGHRYHYRSDLDTRCVTLIHNRGVILSEATSVFASQLEIETILDELIEKAELLIIRNDDAFFEGSS